MKRFGKFRNPRFALTTLQNPSWEVRTRAELIQAAQDTLTEQPEAADFPFAGRAAAPGTPPPPPGTPPPLHPNPPAGPHRAPRCGRAQAANISGPGIRARPRTTSGPGNAP